MQIINLTERDMSYLAEAVTRAQAEGKRFRLSFRSSLSGSSSFAYKVGEGGWSPPHYDDVENDPHRS